MSIAIVKYNAGNVFSVSCAMKRIGAEAVVTDDPHLLASADKVIFPGVGEAASAMEHLRATGLDAVIKCLTQPVLGICIGMQLLCRSSEEGNAQCMGIFHDVDVRRFDNSSNPEFKIPHTGWDTISVTDPANGIIGSDLDGSHLYYVHSYYAPLSQFTIATTDYLLPYSAALRCGNFYGTQFHPEKSGSVGESILRKFISL